MENQNADHFKKGALKKAVKKVGKGIKKAAKAVEKVGERVVGATFLLPLQPFKPAMEKDLNSKGISTKGASFPKIIELFFNENISKKNKKDSHFEPLENNYIEDHYLMKTYPENFNDSDNLAADAIVLIVQETIKYFKGKKDKKAAAVKAGKDPKIELTKGELLAADATEKVTADLQEKAEAEKAVEKGDMSKYIKYAVIIIALGIAVWYFTKKK